MDSLDGNGIDEVLTSTSYGFLGLARDDTPYVIPMSFGYDGDALYFQMNFQGRKSDCIGENAAAAFAVLSIDPATGVSKSVLVEGELSEVRGDDRTPAFEALAANAEFGTSLDIWRSPLEETNLTLFELPPTDITGRVFGEETI